MATQPILVLNGPNLNMLGKREPAIYGTTTLGDIEAACRADGERLGIPVDFRQSNYEGKLIDWCQEARETMSGIVVNPAGLTHVSVPLRDALLASELPVIEVHLSNIHAREPWRNHSYVSDIAVGVICGLGAAGYRFAIEAMADIVTDN
ncbi:MAG: type II 3-dehydroquinate dehydratase [Alphaproteobacteria bacterium]